MMKQKQEALTFSMFFYVAAFVVIEQVNKKKGKTYFSSLLEEKYISLLGNDRKIISNVC